MYTLKGHSGYVWSVAFSHDSTRITSGSEDKTVKIWNASSGEHLHTLKGHSDSVRSVALSHDSTRLASGSGENTVQVWDASSSQCLRTLEVGRTLFNISFDSIGSRLHTEVGAIIISDSAMSNRTTAVTEPLHPRYQYTALSLDNTWITYNSKRVLRLPLDYRPSCSTVSGKMIVVGVGNGKV
jgi:WD40 repeat protein